MDSQHLIRNGVTPIQLPLDLTIVPMEGEDLDDLLRIERASFDDPWSEEMFRREFHLEQSQIWVAKMGEAIVGFLCFWVFSQRSEILNIAIDPLYRRVGIGTLLMERFLDYVRGNDIHEVFLEVRESNEAAIRLYHRFGFKICGKRKGYYRAGKEDALLMSFHP